MAELFSLLLIFILGVFIGYMYFEWKKQQEKDEKRYEVLRKNQKDLLASVNRLERKVGLPPSSTSSANPSFWDTLDYGLDVVKKVATSTEQVLRVGNEYQRLQQNRHKTEQLNWQ